GVVARDRLGDRRGQRGERERGRRRRGVGGDGDPEGLHRRGLGGRVERLDGHVGGLARRRAGGVDVEHAVGVRRGQGRRVDDHRADRLRLLAEGGVGRGGDLLEQGRRGLAGDELAEYRKLVIQ